MEWDEKKRGKFLDDIKEIRLGRLIFIDESGLDNAIFRAYGRAKIGEIRGERSGKCHG